ncbi:MAG: chemotaxis protein CheW, partial [Macromonas sp.]
QAQGQPVQFEVQGGALVLERDLLMRLLPVLEHVLHQWVVHGVQPSAQGAATDHAPQRCLTLAWRQQGHDMVVTLSHDGVGWSAEAGTLAGAAELLCPLGGRLTCVPSAGVGARLEWVLPWCATVTRVVLLRVADVVLAVPTPWVEVVLRASAPQVQAARASGVWVMPSGGTVPFDDGSRVLGLHQEVDGVVEHSTNPFTGIHHQAVLVFHSTGQRVAWHVDEVLGHQEVWVKPPGPQLTHLPGVVGATVLPSGRVALLYDPVRVTVHYHFRML